MTEVFGSSKQVVTLTGILHIWLPFILHEWLLYPKILLHLKAAAGNDVEMADRIRETAMINAMVIQTTVDLVLHMTTIQNSRRLHQTCIQTGEAVTGPRRE